MPACVYIIVVGFVRNGQCILIAPNNAVVKCVQIGYTEPLRDKTLSLSNTMNDVVCLQVQVDLSSHRVEYGPPHNR